MVQAATSSRSGRPIALIAVGVLVALALGGGAYLLGTRPPERAPVMATAASPPVAPVPQAAGPAPSFDVVRVSPQGSAVIAGRAEPGAEVVVFDGTREIARVQADRQGSFVAIPAAPLEAGGRSLTLAAKEAGGAPAARSDGALMVVVPDRVAVAAPQAVAPLAVLVPSAGAPRVLQDPRPAPAGVGLDTVDYDEKGGIRFTGRAEAGSGLRMYVDNKPVGDAVAAGNGRWVMAPGEAVSPGVHALRVDRLGPDGRVLARVEVPFQRASLPPAELGAVAAGERIVVQPGQNLWRMARAAYGSGVRYTVIYVANREQIRDPRLIYPGQAFAVPSAGR